MTKNRIIPYGYAVENGENILHPQESEIVRRVFADYLGGGSLLTIAKALTTEKVEFLPGRSDWNKHRVKRILEDERYIGSDTYPAIIDEDMHRQARTRKDLNNKTVTKSECCFRPPCPVECALCEAPMKRRHDGRRKAAREVWICQNPDCHAIVNIADDALLDEVTAVLNRLIADPTLVTPHSIPAEDASMEVRRLANEVDREMDSFAFDRDKAQKSIFALAGARYRNIDNRQVKAHIVRAAFEESELLSSFIAEIFKRTVLKVRLGGNGVSLILKNDQIIGKEDDHADSSNNTAAHHANA